MINSSSVNPEHPRFVTRSPVKQVVIVTTILALVLGLILIITGSLGLMPLLPAVISGGVILGISASVGGFQLLRLLTKDKKEDVKIKDLGKIPKIITSTPKISQIKKIAGVTFDDNLVKKASQWAKSEAPKVPHIDSQAIVNQKGSTFRQICDERYPDSFHIVCDQNQDNIAYNRIIIGCYPLLIESLIQREKLVGEVDQKKFAASLEEAKRLPNKNEGVLYILGDALPSLSSTFYGITASMGWLI